MSSPILLGLAVLLCGCPVITGDMVASRTLLESSVEGDEAYECSDEADNDQNGLFDCDDPGCEHSPACEEADADADADSDSDADADADSDADCSSIQFHGTNGYMSTSQSISIGQSYTMEAWVKWAGPTSNQWQTIAAHGLSPSDGSLGVDENGRLRHSGGGGNHGAEATLSQDEWTHIAATYDRSSSTSAIYLDGVLAASKSSGFSSAMVGTFWLAGTGSHPEDYPFKGSIFAARVSDSVRYNSDFTPNPAPFEADPSSIGVWNMADLNGSTVPDSTTNGFDLSVVGGSAITDCPSSGDTDGDGDGYIDAAAGGDDCDDTDANIHPFAGDTYDDGVDGDCDGMDCSASSVGTTYFAACHDDKTWPEALSTCTGAGYSSLATVLDATEESFLVDIMKNVYDTSDINDHFWIGINDIAQENAWVWESGLSVSYTNWYSVDNDGDCGRYIGHYPYSWRWGDAPCSYLYNFVCESR